MVHRVRHVRPLPKHRIEVVFDDGVRGCVNLSSLVGKGVFKAWRKPGVFERVFVDEVSGTVAWPGGIDLCPHTLHDDLILQRYVFPAEIAKPTAGCGDFGMKGFDLGLG